MVWSTDSPLERNLTSLPSQKTRKLIRQFGQSSETWLNDLFILSTAPLEAPRSPLDQDALWRSPHFHLRRPDHPSRGFPDLPLEDPIHSAVQHFLKSRTCLQVQLEPPSQGSHRCLVAWADRETHGLTTRYVIICLLVHPPRGEW